MNKKDIFEWIICILIALVIVSIITSFVGFPTVVSGNSMDSTLLDKQRLWVSKIAIRKDKYPERGDIITFEAPDKDHQNRTKTDNVIAIYTEKKESVFSKLIPNMSFMKSTSYIKRVIGLPGDHIEIKNEGVYRNGARLEESYLDPGTVTESTHCTFIDLTVPDGCVYVLGDNREVSLDSRRFGCIPIEKIEGKAVFRFWPLNKIGKINKK